MVSRYDAQAKLCARTSGTIAFWRLKLISATEKSIEATLSAITGQWGAIDCLVANVGGGRGARGWNVEEAEWHRLFEQNLWCSVRLVQHALTAMTKLRQASIVLVASIVGLESTAAPLPYSAAKAAVVSYGKNLARALGASNIRVNTVAPGNVLFEGSTWETRLRERQAEVVTMLDNEVPLRRFGDPQEIADLIAFLSSDRAAFITGSCIVVDGGQMRSV